MAEWANQITEIQRSWVERQQKLLSDWLDTAKKATGDPSRANWRKAMDVMQEQVDSALEAQKRSLLAFAGNMEKTEGVPEAFTQGVKQLEEGIEQWAEMQHGVWHVWFDMLRSAAPQPATPADAMLEGWEDMVKRTIDMQEDWLSKWSEFQMPTGEPPAKKPTQPGS